MLDYIKKNWIGLLCCIIGVELIGFIGGFFSQGSQQVYQNLIKPPLSPPSVLFGIVWPILYALLAISLYRVFSSVKSEQRKKALIIFAVQLIVNIFWPLIFFSFMNYTAAAFVLIILDLLVILMYIKFKSIDNLSSKLLIPYLIWIIYATYLNLGIVFLN